MTQVSQCQRNINIYTDLIQVNEKVKNKVKIMKNINNFSFPSFVCLLVCLFVCLPLTMFVYKSVWLLDNNIVNDVSLNLHENDNDDDDEDDDNFDVAVIITHTHIQTPMEAKRKN